MSSYHFYTQPCNQHVDFTNQKLLGIHWSSVALHDTWSSRSLSLSLSLWCHQTSRCLGQPKPSAVLALAWESLHVNLAAVAPYLWHNQNTKQVITWSQNCMSKASVEVNHVEPKSGLEVYDSIYGILSLLSQDVRHRSPAARNRGTSGSAKQTRPIWEIFCIPNDPNLVGYIGKRIPFLFIDIHIDPYFNQCPGLGHGFAIYLYVDGSIHLLFDGFIDLGKGNFQASNGSVSGLPCL